MACKRWSKGWQDRVNPPYNQHYCTYCWATYMGCRNISSKDTVWLRETWKADNRAVSHHATCARAARHEARKRKGKEVPAHPSTWSSAFPDPEICGDRDADDEASVPSKATLGGRDGISEKCIRETDDEASVPSKATLGDRDGMSEKCIRESDDEASLPSKAKLGDRDGMSEKCIREECEDSAIGKTIVFLRASCGMPAGSKARVIGIKATNSGIRQRFTLGPMWKGQRLGHSNGVLTDKLGKLFNFCEAEAEADAEDQEHETPPWLQRGIDVLWQEGGGNMHYTTFQKRVGQRAMAGVRKNDVLARPEFEVCGGGKKSIRLAGWLRIQRYR